MSASGSPVDTASSALAGGSRAAWIESPAFDGSLLIFSPVLVLPLVGLAFWIPWLAAGIAFMLAFSHYASTSAFFFWDDSREYHRARWIAFYAGPMLIVVVYVLLLAFSVPYIIQFLILFWNAWHVARQNCGILSIYRSQAGIADSSLRQKAAANNAIIAVSVYLVLWNVDSNKEVVALFGLVSDEALDFTRIVAVLAATFFSARLLTGLFRRREPVGPPEALFLASSLVFFYPYLVFDDSGFATAVMLLPHYVQYLALVWMLHRRKFGAASAGAPFALRMMSMHLRVLVPVLVAVGFAFLVLKYVANYSGNAAGFENLYLLIAFTHFYLDGVIWSFKRPHVRKTMLPFLVRRNSAVPAPAQ